MRLHEGTWVEGGMADILLRERTKVLRMRRCRLVGPLPCVLALEVDCPVWVESMEFQLRMDGDL